MSAIWFAALIAAQDISATTGSARPDTAVSQLAAYSLSISADGRWLAYGRSSPTLGNSTTGTLWVRDLARGTSIHLATNDYATPNYGPKPVWSPDGRMLAYYGVSNGELQLRVWDRERGRELQTTAIPVSTASFLSYQWPHWTPDGRFVLSIADTGRAKPLWEEQESDPSLARLRAELVGQLWHIAGTTRSGTATAGRSLRVLNGGSLPAPGITRLLTWKSSSGDSLFALLRLPPGLPAGERVPVVMDVYPGRSGRSNALRFDGGVSRLDPLRSRGRFALLTPDLPVQFGNGRVCGDFARYAVEALDAAIASSRVDSARAGVMGLSYGGYAVNCIVTHTNRFRAAASEVGPSHITSARALGGRGVTNVTGNWPWEAPDRMIAESPVYHLDEVETPLLLVAGKHDLGNALQAYEMYFGLLTLKKPVALLSYDDAGHGDYDRFADFWPRVVAWFGTHLQQPAALRAGGVEK
ncbi:MAG: S9 family peptidase [Gemmatimonadaceae bacterium]